MLLLSFFDCLCSFNKWTVTNFKLKSSIYKFTQFSQRFLCRLGCSCSRGGHIYTPSKIELLSLPCRIPHYNFRFHADMKFLLGEFFA